MIALRLIACVLAAGCGAAGSASGSGPVSNRTEPSPPAPVRAIESASGGASRQMSRTERGGVLQLEGDRPAAMGAASKTMIAHCGAGNYMITQEGEEPDGAGMVWRVHYECACSP